MSDKDSGANVALNEMLGGRPVAWLRYSPWSGSSLSASFDFTGTVDQTPLYVIPKGWRLVPEVPTPEMHRAVCELEGCVGFTELWRAAVAAAPQPDA